MSWLASQKLEYAEQRIVFEEMMLAMRQAQERLDRLVQAIRLRYRTGRSPSRSPR